jgi:hypothetical protein
MFTSEMLKARVKQQPFAPLRIVTSSGESYTVTHPDLLWVGVRDVHIGIASAKNPTVYADVARVALMHITALEDLPVPPASQGNGEQ